MQLKLMRSTSHSLLLAVTPQAVNVGDKEQLLAKLETILVAIETSWQVLLHCFAEFTTSHFQSNGFQRLLTAFLTDA
jgi:hypothetical protein